MSKDKEHITQVAAHLTELYSQPSAGFVPLGQSLADRLDRRPPVPGQSVLDIRAANIGQQSAHDSEQGGIIEQAAHLREDHARHIGSDELRIDESAAFEAEAFDTAKYEDALFEPATHKPMAIKLDRGPRLKSLIPYGYKRRGHS